MDLQGTEIEALGYAGIFLGVLLAFEGLRQILGRGETLNEVRNRRMKLIRRGATTADVLQILKPRQEDWALSRIPLIGPLPKVLRQAGLSTRPQSFVSLCLLGAACLAVVGSALIPPAAAAGIAGALCIGLPLLVVRQMQARRMDALVAQMPDALDLMARGLMVGHPLNATMASVARDMADPIASEFGVMVDQVAFGDDLVDAFADFAERTGLEDVRYLSVSVAIQHGTGGDLARVLSTLGRVIRDRISMRKRVKALSAEGRLTSIFLSSLPLFILVATSITSPTYYFDVKDDPLFRPFAIAVFVLISVNFVVMRRMVNFRI
ncbi:type II secretion system F family protein [Rhodobacter sp. CZR27]|uniref:type II secretion system F family protein n=1 Tax=Rhodobacter sp. CZR27 TaxID=2033869 RepID=UPI000BBEF22E|nr:type II secretion system F family protein [Rhodobacter sp. CZR27]